MFRLRIDPIARQNMREFAEYLSDYDQQFADEQVERLDRLLSVNIAGSPLTWGYFPLTGAPYRGYLFRVGRHTQYWIVYTVDEDSRGVHIVRFWNTSRDPET